MLKQNEESSKFGTGDYTYVCNSELVLKKNPKLGSRKEIVKLKAQRLIFPNGGVCQMLEEENVFNL